jgi:hypothetical protein
MLKRPKDVSPRFRFLHAQTSGFSLKRLWSGATFTHRQNFGHVRHRALQTLPLGTCRLLLHKLGTMNNGVCE